MSAETVTQTAPSDEVVSHARSIGWAPKDEFKGDPGKWVDADVFVAKSEEVLPYVKTANKRLLAEQGVMRQQLADLTAQLEATRGNLEAFEEFHQEEVVRRVAETRRELLSRLKQAKNDQDVDAEVELTDELTKLNAAGLAAKSEGEQKKVVKNGHDVIEQPIQPELVAWLKKHPQMDRDPVFTHQVMALGHKIKQEQPDLLGQDFFDELDARLEDDETESTRGRKAKVERSRGGGTQKTTTSRGYDDLPADAKAICDKYAKHFVNPKGPWKTVADYRKHYVEELERSGGL